MNKDSVSTRTIRPISLPPKTQLSALDTQIPDPPSSPNRPSIRQLTSYYEQEARKSLQSPSMINKSIETSLASKPSLENLIVTYSDKIKKLEFELMALNEKIATLKANINDVIINKNNNKDPQFELLELSTLYNEEIIILGSIYTYNQMVKNIVKHNT
jgi:hypothetical protein